MDHTERSYETHASPIYLCSVCHGHVRSEDLALPPGLPESLPGQKLYCPHCEMLVEPEIETEAAKLQEGHAAHGDAAAENRGRDRQSGSNAGGSQRGDLSDEGATQWRVDPQEDLRNTWQDKPLRPPGSARS